MREQFQISAPKWPFLIGDGLLLAIGSLIAFRAKPLDGLPLCLAVICVVAGATFAIVPFILEHRSLTKLAQTDALTDALAQIQSLEKIAAKIDGATGQWENIQEQADKTAEIAGNLTKQITTESRSFAEFLQRASDSEKATLRLEVEKLRRAENDWLQAMVRVLDHCFALHLGAVRSGQSSLIGQVSKFQQACHDAARRVGLTPFVAQESETFDAQRHQLVNGDGKTASGGLISETLASGYTFQGRLLRPALVRLREITQAATATGEPRLSSESVPEINRG